MAATWRYNNQSNQELKLLVVIGVDQQEQYQGIHYLQHLGKVVKKVFINVNKRNR